MTDFVKQATKKSLLAFLKDPQNAGPNEWRRVLDALVTKDELKNYVEGASSTSAGSRGGLSGLFVKRDGSTALTGNWDAGPYKITAKRFESDIVTGTSPFVVSSTTVVTNLNADQVDGKDSTALLLVDGSQASTGQQTFNSGIKTNTINERSVGVGVTVQGVVCSGSILYAANGVKANTIDEYLNGSGVTVDTLLIKDGNIAAIDYSFVTANDGSTDVTASELEELSDGSVTTLHDHDVTGLTNWPTIDYSYVSGNDGSTDVSAAELEELTDGSTTALHTHSIALNAEAITMTVSNDSGSAMAKGDLCYISGDSSGVPQVTLADADAAGTATGMLVCINETINNGADGAAVVYGWITGLSGLTAAAIQYVHTTAGDFTETAPSGSGDIIRIAGYAMSTTEIFFNPDGYWTVAP